jgi:hypothetical protein
MMKHVFRLSARSVLGASMMLAASLAWSTNTTVTTGGTFDLGGLPGSAQLQSGSSQLRYNDNFLAFLDDTNAQGQSHGAATYTGPIDEFGFHDSSAVASPLSSVTIDTATQVLNGFVTNGGMTLTTPFLKSISNGGSLTITDLRADLNSGLVFGKVIGGNGVGTLDDMALWQASNITSTSNVEAHSLCLPDELCMGGGVYERINSVHADLSDLMLTQQGKDVFSRSLALQPLMQTFLNNDLPLGKLSFDAQFKVAVGQNISVVPEPGTWALMGLGLVGLFAASRRKSR